MRLVVGASRGGGLAVPGECHRWTAKGGSGERYPPRPGVGGKVGPKEPKPQKDAAPVVKPAAGADAIDKEKLQKKLQQQAQKIEQQIEPAEQPSPRNRARPRRTMVSGFIGNFSS